MTESNTPTPRTDAAVEASDGQWSFALRDECQRIERDLVEAQDTITRALKSLPVGYLPNHTSESLPSRIDHLAKELADAREQLESWQKLALSSEVLQKRAVTECAEAKEQRDRLAEALQDIRNRALDETIGLHPDAEAKGCVDDCLEWAESALAALKGGADE